MTIVNHPIWRILSIIGMALLTGGCNTLSQGQTSFPFPLAEDPIDRETLPYYVSVIPIGPGSEQLSPAPQPPSLSNNHELDEQIASSEYLVGPGDVLNIVVWDHPELTLPSGPQRSASEGGSWIHADGSIFYPYVGRIEVAGSTLERVRTKISKGLEEFIPEPQVDVTVAAFRSQYISISGEVGTPGRQAITNIPLTLVDAINAAGGPSEFADLRRVKIARGGTEITRDVQALLEHGDGSQNLLLTHQDRLHIPKYKENYVFILGEIEEPGLHQLKDRAISLTEVLAARGGLSASSADARGVLIFRHTPKPDLEEHISVYQLDVSLASSYMFGTKFYLQPQDLVFITNDPFSAWNKIINKILPSINGIGVLSNLGKGSA